MTTQSIWLIKRGHIRKVEAEIDENGNAHYFPDPNQRYCEHFVKKKDFALSFGEAAERLSERNARYIIDNIYKFAFKIDIINVGSKRK